MACGILALSCTISTAAPRKQDIAVVYAPAVALADKRELEVRVAVMVGGFYGAEAEDAQGEQAVRSWIVERVQQDIAPVLTASGFVPRVVRTAYGHQRRDWTPGVLQVECTGWASGVLRAEIGSGSAAAIKVDCGAWLIHPVTNEVLLLAETQGETGSVMTVRRQDSPQQQAFRDALSDARVLRVHYVPSLGAVLEYRDKGRVYVKEVLSLVSGGFQQGDMIEQIDTQKKVRSCSDISSVMRDKLSGRPLRIVVRRNKKRVAFDLVPSAWWTQRAQSEGDEALP